MLFYALILVCFAVLLELSLADQELFAVFGRSYCSQNLPSGDQSVSETGAADGQYPQYLSTNSIKRDIKHAYWLQIVTSNGIDELFRIYWTFSSSQLLSEIIRNAAFTGVEVQYLVVDAKTNDRYVYNKLWKISVADSTLTLDANIGSVLNGAERAVWGVSTTDTTLNTPLWGIGQDNNIECSLVYNNGMTYEYNSVGKTYMYLSTVPFPQSTQRSHTSKSLHTYNTHTHTNNSAKNRIDTAGVSDISTSSLTPSGYELFAIVGENSCAGNLYYGPSAITTSGSSDGYTYYLSTNTAGKNNLHNRWLQLVTDETGAEIFRITWNFATYKTLDNHIINAVSTGETVSYTVLNDGVSTYYTDSLWRFSSNSFVTNARFTATSTQCCFSFSGGAWGAGAPTVDASVAGTYNTQQFWGTANYGSYDQSLCKYVFESGQPGVLSGGHTPRSYLYYATDGPPTKAPTATPTTAFPSTSRPTVVPTSSRPTFQPTWRPSAVPTSAAPSFTVTAQPTALPTVQPTVTPTATKAPTALPTTAEPSATPTVAPTTTSAPTAVPSTATPSADPSTTPTVMPSTLPPTPMPTAVPTVIPTTTPTVLPTTTPIPTCMPTTSTPTIIPSARPTPAPTFAPTPTPRPTYAAATELFAVVGGTSCAESLYYGPQAITTAGSADGLHPYYFSTGTASRNIAHTTWMQVVTTDGSNELFRIFWTFNTAKTLSERFIGAVSVGESVSFRIVLASTGAQYAYSGTWWFSSRSGITSSTFTTTTTNSGFSSDNGVWGAGSGTIDGTNVNTLYSSKFWGIGNFEGTDSGSGNCRTIYQNSGITYQNNAVKSYMYYSAGGTAGETFDLKFQISMLMRPMNHTTYLAKTALYRSVLSKTISSALTTVSEADISDITVADATTATSSASVINSVGVTSVVSSVTKYLRGMSHITRRLDASTNATALVTLVVTLQASTYTLYQMSQQLQSSIDSGSIDTYLHNYANSLQVYELNNTMVISASTSELSTASSDSNSPSALTPGIIAAIAIGAIAIMILVGTLIVACVRGESPSDWMWSGRRRNSRVWVEPPPSDSSSHSESDLPVYPTTATYDMDIDAEIATINQFHATGAPTVGILASQDSDLDDFVAHPRQNRRHRNTRDRGATEVAWNTNNNNRSNNEVETHTDVVVPRAIIARHQRNAPIVRAHYIDGDVPEAEEASVNYGQYGSDVVVAEAFVPNT